MILNDWGWVHVFIRIFPHKTSSSRERGQQEMVRETEKRTEGAEEAKAAAVRSRSKIKCRVQRIERTAGVLDGKMCLPLPVRACVR